MYQQWIVILSCHSQPNHVTSLASHDKRQRQAKTNKIVWIFYYSYTKSFKGRDIFRERDTFFMLIDVCQIVAWQNNVSKMWRDYYHLHKHHVVVPKSVYIKHIHYYRFFVTTSMLEATILCVVCCLSCCCRRQCFLLFHWRQISQTQERYNTHSSINSW